MDRMGICGLCGGLAKPAFTCNMCGALVCGKCIDHNIGLCRMCAVKAKRPQKRF